MSHVQKALEAWRDAERELESASDPESVAQLRDRIRKLQDEYQAAVDARVTQAQADTHADAREY